MQKRTPGGPFLCVKSYPRGLIVKSYPRGLIAKSYPRGPIAKSYPRGPIADQVSSPAQISVGFPPSFMPTATSATRTTAWTVIAGTVPSTPKATL